MLDLSIALAAALTGGFAARLLKLPPLAGYLVAGIVVGPHTPGIFARPEPVQQIAQLGAALLMFAVGVHFSLGGLLKGWRTAVLGGGAQIIGTILLGIGVGLLLGWGLYGGLFLGCAISLSSTAVMMKVLEERGELGTAHGVVMLGILVVQDLSLVAMVAILPAISLISQGSAGAAASVGMALLRAVLFVGITLLLAIRVVPSLIHRVALTGSRELFLLAVVCLCLLAALGAEAAGLGVELGAFIAGLVISETDYAHEVFSQVRPLRDVFASLFFVSIGMLLEPRFLVTHWLAIAAVVAAILLGKSLIAALAVYAAGWHGRTAIQVGLGLAQIGEFSFVLASIGSGRGLIPSQIGAVLLSSALITLLLAPFVYQAAIPLYTLLNRTPLSGWLNRQRTVQANPDPGNEAHRVIVFGYGRVGRRVSDAMAAKDVRHLVVDYDAAAIQRAGMRTDVLYGDASSETVLNHARPRDAALAVVALPEHEMTEAVVRSLRRLSSDIEIMARVHRGVDIPRMRAAGATAVIHAEFEASAEMIRQSLDRLGFPDSEVDGYLEQVRQMADNAQ